MEAVDDAGVTRELLDAMFAASPDLLALIRPDGTVLRTNPAWQRILGWTEEELRGGSLAALRHPDDAPADAPILGSRVRWRHRDGGHRWVQCHGAVLEEQHLVLVAGRDVTDTVAAEQASARAALRHAEEAAEREELLARANAAVQALEQERGAVLAAMHQLERSERQFAEVFDHSPVAKIVVGLRGPGRGRILLANPAFHELLGFTREQLTGLRIQDITTRPVEELEQTLQLLASGEQTRGRRESVLIRADGSLVDALSRTSAIADDHGPVTAVVQLLDMTAERRARADLQTSERRFRLTFDNSPLGVTLCSLRPADRGRFLQVNPAMTAITGYAADELTTMTYADLLHPSSPVPEVLEDAAGERRYRHKDGHTVWVAERAAVVRDPDGTARYAVHQVEDITARRAADVQLRRQARLLDLIPAAVIVRDVDGAIRWWNEGAAELYGWPLTAAQGKVTHRLLATGFPEGCSPESQREALDRDGAWSGQLHHLTADGRLLTVLSRQVLHHPEHGEAQVLEINTDVTAARAAEIALAESEQRFRAQFVNSAVGQLVCSLDGRIIDANPAYAAMIGYTVEQLTGMYERDLINPADLAAGRHRTAALFAGEADSYLLSSRARHAGGHLVDVEATVSLVRDSDDRPKHLIAVTSDISARRAAEQARDAATAALTERNRELEDANQLKLDIIGMLGHEIGNPLTTIQGNAEILADDWPAMPEQHRARVVQAIVRQAERLDEIVREVLAMVTIDAGMAAAERRELSVRAEITQALMAANRGDVPVHGADVRVWFQPGHLQQILVNLLSNAAKYGGGATAIRVERRDDRVEVVVEDEGPGVPEEFRDRLFERLARAERDAESVKGTGLGLYIVRGLASANGAGIRHEPNPAGGSRFILSIQPASPTIGPGRH